MRTRSTVISESTLFHSRKVVNILPKIGRQGLYYVNSHRISKPERTGECNFPQNPQSITKCLLQLSDAMPIGFIDRMPSSRAKIEVCTDWLTTNRIKHEVDALTCRDSFSSSTFIDSFSVVYCKRQYTVSLLILLS